MGIVSSKRSRKKTYASSSTKAVNSGQTVMFNVCSKEEGVSRDGSMLSNGISTSDTHQQVYKANSSSSLTSSSSSEVSTSNNNEKESLNNTKSTKSTGIGVSKPTPHVASSSSLATNYS